MSPSDRGKPHSDSAFTRDVARFYDTNLVPLIFEGYAQDLAERTQSLAPKAVLEVACGTGVVTRALAKELAVDCMITATDLNDGMITYAESVGAERPVTWQQADVMSLPFEEASFDVVVCQFSVMFFPDRVAAYQEIKRVLRPGGRFLFSVWNDTAGNDFAATVTEAIAAHFPGNPPEFLARTPHGHGISEEIHADVRDAGFEHCEITARADVSRAASPELVALAYCQGTPLRIEIESRDANGLDSATLAVADAVRARYGDGPVEGRINAVVVHAH